MPIETATEAVTALEAARDVERERLEARAWRLAELAARLLPEVWRHMGVHVEVEVVDGLLRDGCRVEALDEAEALLAAARERVKDA